MSVIWEISFRDVGTSVWYHSASGCSGAGVQTRRESRPSLHRVSFCTGARGGENVPSLPRYWVCFSIGQGLSSHLKTQTGWKKLA